jgi:hypothetical protein
LRVHLSCPLIVETNVLARLTAVYNSTAVSPLGKLDVVSLDVTACGAHYTVADETKP